MSTRRTFLTGSASAVAGTLASSQAWAAETSAQPCATEIASLCGEWLFRVDPDNLGTKKNWCGTDIPGGNWRTVTVPHTWQVEAELADFRGVAWYWRSFHAAESWQECAVRVQFEAVLPHGDGLGQRAACRRTRVRATPLSRLTSRQPCSRVKPISSQSVSTMLSINTCCLAVGRVTGQMTAASSGRFSYWLHPRPL